MPSTQGITAVATMYGGVCIHLFALPERGRPMAKSTCRAPSVRPIVLNRTARFSHQWSSIYK